MSPEAFWRELYVINNRFHTVDRENLLVRTNAIIQLAEKAFGKIPPEIETEPA